MRAVFGLVLIVGVALAGGAVMMANKFITEYKTELANERAQREAIVPTVEVFVAERPLRYGETLKPDAVRAVRWPENAIPEGAFTDKDKLFPPELTELRYVLRAMEKDEAILALKVTEPGEDAGITSRLERGMRAFAIKVDVASGVSGFLRPTDRVDVYWTGRVRSNDPNLPNGEVTKLIETGVKLIAIDQTSETDTAQTTIARTVTVAASPQQVASLAQAQSTGRLSLSLMGRNDDTVAEVIEVDQRTLLGIEARSEVEKRPALEVCTIRTRRGGEVVEVPIPCTN